MVPSGDVDVLHVGLKRQICNEIGVEVFYGKAIL